MLSLVQKVPTCVRTTANVSGGSSIHDDAHESRSAQETMNGPAIFKTVALSSGSSNAAESGSVP